MTSVEFEEFEEYDESSVKTWENIVARQVVRDNIFFPRMKSLFNPGSVLDLGAACGQTSRYLEELGFDVVTSDIHPFFVNYMQNLGYDAHQIDATNIQGALGQRTFDNVFSQGLSPQMWKVDRSLPTRTYLSIWKALRPGGRYIAICGLYNYRKRYEKKRYFASIDEHRAFIEEMDIFTVKQFIPHMVLPPRIYRSWNRQVLNLIDFQLAKLLPNRVVMLLEKKGDRLPARYQEESAQTQHVGETAIANVA